MENEDNMSLRVASFSCYLDRDKENLVRRISAQETPLVINSGKGKSPSIKSPFHANISHSKDAQDSLKNGRTDSFSYLNTSGENFVFKVPRQIQDPVSAFTFSQDHHSKDGEISVFGADRYFNMKLEYTSGLKREFNKNRPVNLPRISSNAFKETRSLASETSSWTSQTEIMQNLRRNYSQTKQKKSTSWRIFAGFGCQVPCFDKKNVKINDQIIPHDITYKTSKAGRTGSDRISHHLTKNPDQESQYFIIDKIEIEEEKSEEARFSIEVFGSRISSKGDIATNLERKLSMLTWDAIPDGKSHQNSIPAASTIGTSTIICDDMASDASSDLFEIDNISGCINQILASKTDQDDVVSCCMSPISQYAPSEASIQWSVVTAGAVDYSSVLSDTEERCVSISGDMVSRNNNMNPRNRNGGGKEAQKIRPGGLLGCKNQKSVDVADQIVCLKALEKVKH
ncbi:protein PHYTOCHROME KINASE SUBSTRATE 3-like [Primulina huaijiensis]|uniref:protein PHYTOCHROME KINASE SUBSTRATE 3-like n=1 Tax=Primulina huaijiensis TaxID=1492673 RepID=UPI003CC73C45